MGSRGPKRRYEYCLNSRLESSFPPLGTREGPWCKFCHETFTMGGDTEEDNMAGLMRVMKANAAIQRGEGDWKSFNRGEIERYHARICERAQEGYVNSRRARMISAVETGMRNAIGADIGNPYSAMLNALHMERQRLRELPTERVMAEWEKFNAPEALSA